MRIAVVLKDRCQPKRCNLECINYCPPNRTGQEVIVLGGEAGKAVISEELCIGCGICVHKCPFDAIRIIGLPEELKADLVHQFGQNTFRLYRLPIPRRGQVIGLLGPNGIGKTTTISLLSGQEIPNLGNYDEPPSWEKVLEFFAGTQLHDHFHALADGKIRTALKPQYVDKLPKAHRGMVRELLRKVDERGKLDEVIDQLELEETLARDLGKLSGGELQRVAIAATLLKDVQIYFFDEPSSYLDIHQRLRVARILQRLGEERQVVVIEHDLAVLDFLAELVHLLYGVEGAYGILSQPRPVRTAINVYLDGYMREENVRFRETPIRFEPRPPRIEWQTEPLVRFEPLRKRFRAFKLETQAGVIHRGEVVGVLGPNATGKTTFVRMLARDLEPTQGKVEGDIRVSYKPQYLKPDHKGTVRELFFEGIGETFDSGFFQSEVALPLNLKPLYDKELRTLSGGELQRAAIALCLGRDADLYLLDEPSAYLDSNQRMIAAKTIRRAIEKAGHTALIVDHDVYMIDLIADSLMVFSGEPSRHGIGEGPFGLREGMNRFLRMVDVTFRRDADSHRPRINKAGSRLDREQKALGEYYYTVEPSSAVPEREEA